MAWSTSYSIYMLWNLWRLFQTSSNESDVTLVSSPLSLWVHSPTVKKLGNRVSRIIHYHLIKMSDANKTFRKDLKFYIRRYDKAYVPYYTEWLGRRHINWAVSFSFGNNCIHFKILKSYQILWRINLFFPRWNERKNKHLLMNWKKKQISLDQYKLLYFFVPIRK